MQLQQQYIKQNMFANNFLVKATVSPCTIPDSILFPNDRHNTEICKSVRLMSNRKLSDFQDNLLTEFTFHSHTWFVIYSHVLCKAVFPDTTLSWLIHYTYPVCTTASQFALNYKLINHLP